MNDEEFALECMRVDQLDFVSQVILSPNLPFVYVKLSLTLSDFLPSYLSTMEFPRSEFSVKSVMARFEIHIVERLVTASELAQEQLQSAKIQLSEGDQ